MELHIHNGRTAKMRFQKSQQCLLKRFYLTEFYHHIEVTSQLVYIIALMDRQTRYFNHVSQAMHILLLCQVKY